MDQDPLADSLDETTALDGLPTELDDQPEDNLEEETRETPPRSPQFATLEEAEAALEAERLKHEEAQRFIGRQATEIGQLRKAQPAPEPQPQPQVSLEQQVYQDLEPLAQAWADEAGLEKDAVHKLLYWQEMRHQQELQKLGSQFSSQLEQYAPADSYVPDVSQALDRVKVPGVTAQEISTAMKQKGISLSQFRGSPTQMQDEFVETFAYSLLGRKAAQGKSVNLKPPPQVPPGTGPSSQSASAAAHNPEKDAAIAFYMRELELDKDSAEEAWATAQRGR